MAKKKNKENRPHPATKALKNEEAMIAGIIEGSPDAIGVAVVRLQCGCKKMAAVDKEGEPASKVVIYRDGADSVCPLCKEDNGAFARVSEAFIEWENEPEDESARQKIELKVLGNMPKPQ